MNNCFYCGAKLQTFNNVHNKNSPTVKKMLSIMAKNKLTILEMTKLLNCSKRTLYRWFSDDFDKKIPDKYFELLQLRGIK